MYLKKMILSMLTLTHTAVFAGNMGAAANVDRTHNNIYIGAFGGGAASTSHMLAQSAVAYRFVGQQFQGQTTPTDEDYNLFVNVAGKSHVKTAGIAGLHLGYQWGAFQIGKNAAWDLRPAIEIEGYYLASKMGAYLFNPELEPAVLPNGSVAPSHSIAARQHVFSDHFNLNAAVFLANSVLTLKTPLSEKLLPYAGAGMGFAYHSISAANSAQIGPYNENSPYINHFNSDPRASDSVFAAQVKAGVKAEMTEHIALFAEYRYLYISPTSYTFGSTQYPNQHPDTSLWRVNFSSMNLNAAVLGVKYCV